MLKRLIGILALALALCLSAGARAELVGHWNMDDDAENTNVEDYSLKENDGTFNDAGGDPNTDAHHSADRKFGTGSLEFDGVDDFVKCDGGTSVTITQATGLTMAAWIKPDVVNISGWIINDGSKYGLYQRNDEIAYSLGGTVGFDYTTGVDFVAGTWYHVAVTADASGVKLYVDGVLKKSDPGGNFTNSSPWWIGARCDGLQKFDGLLDDVGVWDHVLTDGGIGVGDTATQGSELYNIIHNGIPPIPEPGTMLLAGFGVLVLLLSRRKR